MEFPHSPLCADVLLLDRHAGHLPQPHPHLDVPELQAQVLPQNGDSGSPLTRTRLREQLREEEEEDERIEVKKVEDKEEGVEEMKEEGGGGGSERNVMKGRKVGMRRR